MKYSFPCPVRAVAILAGELRKHGAHVLFDEGFPVISGSVHSVSGTFKFLHDGKGQLSVEIVSDLGHFPAALLKGGMRQMIEEAVERL